MISLLALEGWIALFGLGVAVLIIAVASWIEYLKHK